jgi:GT2 family glycosyltransferase
MSETAVVILNWNGKEYLKMFLKSVVRYSLNDKTAVYVADNGSTDGSADWVAENHPEVNLIKFEKNHGFANGYNLALEKAAAKYYVLLNSDVEVTEGWLDPLVSFMEINSDVASCQPKVLSYMQKDTFEYAGAAGGFIDRFGFPFCRGRIFNYQEKDKGQYDKQGDIFWSTGACMIVRASAWEKCGRFDADFFAHMEEIDLCWRFHRAGYRVSAVPQSIIYHIGGGVLPYDSPFKTYLNFRNSLFLLYKNLSDKNFNSTMFCRKLLDAVAALFFLAKGELRSAISVWKAHTDFYRNIKSLKEKREKIRTLGNLYPGGLILNKSIVFEFYIKRHKTFESLKTKF